MTSAPRRNMTPEEISALWAQSKQGMQPQIAPMSLMDLTMEGVGAFLDEADIAKYLLPLSLLGMVKGGKTAPGSRTLRETIDNPAGTVLYRGTEARNPSAILRVAPAGELGSALYATPHQWLAETYGGGPGASVKKGTRLVHEFGISDTSPGEVAYLRGGSRGDADAVLVKGDGTELWRGRWSAKKAELENMRAMNQAARDAGVKIIHGDPDSIALNQTAILDPGVIQRTRTLKLKAPRKKSVPPTE